VTVAETVVPDAGELIVTLGVLPPPGWLFGPAVPVQPLFIEASNNRLAHNAGPIRRVGVGATSE